MAAARRRLLLSRRAQGESGVEKLRRLCREHGVREETAAGALSRISGKQNCFRRRGVGQVAERPGSAGAACGGYITSHGRGQPWAPFSTALLGLGILDLVVRPAADPFDPAW